MGIFNRNKKGMASQFGQLTTDGIFYKYRNMFISDALALGKYDNMPDTCNMNYAEKCLLNGQNIAWGEDERTGFLFTLPYVPRPSGIATRWTVYGVPQRIEMIPDPLFGSRRIPSTRFALCYDDVKNMPGPETGYISRMDIINYGAQLCWEIENSFRSNLMHQNKPFILYGNTKDILSRANFWEMFQDFRPYIMAEKGAKVEEMLATVDLKVDYIGGQLLSDLQTVINMIHALLGYPIGTEKHERQLVNEVTANLFAESAQANAYCIPREEMVKRGNALFGCDAKFSLRESPIMAMTVSGTSTEDMQVGFVNTEKEGEQDV